MRQAEDALGTMTVWLAVSGIALISMLALTLSLLEMRFNLGAVILVSALIVTSIGIRYFSRRHLAECSATSLLGLTLSIIGQLCIVAMTITSVGLLLLPAAVMSIGLLIMALINQLPLGRTSNWLD